MAVAGAVPALPDVLGDALGDVLLLLCWENLMLVTGITSLCAKPHSGMGAETRLPFSQ